MSITFDYAKDYGVPPFPIIELTIIGSQPEKAVTTRGLVDSGADATLIPLDILKDIQARQRDRAWIRTIASDRYAIYLYSVSIQIGEHKLYGIEAIANERTDEIIIGRDVLNQLIVTLDGLGEVTEIRF